MIMDHIHAFFDAFTLQKRQALYDKMIEKGMVFTGEALLNVLVFGCLRNVKEVKMFFNTHTDSRQGLCIPYGKEFVHCSGMNENPVEYAKRYFNCDLEDNYFDVHTLKINNIWRITEKRMVAFEGRDLFRATDDEGALKRYKINGFEVDERMVLDKKRRIEFMMQHFQEQQKRNRIK